ncbi:MAG: hypothetical protein HYZ50_26255 [Deltaproteobacteria bacterium]|nr:hypothetical protein [Deltaproteobacteria bacterium]
MQTPFTLPPCTVKCFALEHVAYTDEGTPTLMVWLIFDEATLAFDAHIEREIIHAIEALHGKKTLVIVAHRLSTVQACDRLVFLQEGRIVGYGRFADLVVQNEEFHRMATLAELPIR